MKIIMLGHRKRQGKDTFAQMLNERLPNSKIVSFARPMKEIVYELWGVDFEIGELLKNYITSFRQQLQVFGSGKMKELFGPSVWRDVLLKNAPECDYLIIPDFRFPEEEIEGALTIKVHRDENYDDEHISETALKDYRFMITIENKGTFTELEKKADYIAKLVQGRI